MKTLALLICAVAAPLFAASENALLNGSLNALNPGKTLPENWTSDTPENIKLAGDDGSHWIAFTDGGRMIQQIAVKPEWKWLRIGASMRASNLKVGDRPGQNARIVCLFKRANGPSVETAAPEMVYDSEWMPRAIAVKVPEGATALSVEPGLYLSSGTFEVDDISVSPVDEEEAKRINDAARRLNNAVPLTDGKLVGGDFERLDAEGRPAGWLGLEQAGVSIAAEGKNHYLQIDNDDPKKSKAAVLYVLLPKGIELRVRARMKAGGLKGNGAQPPSARLRVALVDEAGQNPVLVPVSEFTRDTDWTEVLGVSHELHGAMLAITPGLFETAGMLSVDDIRVEVISAPAGAPGAKEVTGLQASASAPNQSIELNGTHFGPAVATELVTRLGKNRGRPRVALVAAGKPGAIVLGAGWTMVSDKSITATPFTAGHGLVALPDVLAKERPEVVFLVGEALGAGQESATERADWLDLCRVCLRYGAVPVLVPPATTNDEKKDLVRREMLGVAVTHALPATTYKGEESRAYGNFIRLLERHVWARVPLDGGNVKDKDIE